MSLFKYFGKKDAIPTPEQAGLSEKATKAANAAVMEVKSRKSKCYINFTDEDRAKIGQYAAENANNSALKKFRAQFSDLGESTVYMPHHCIKLTRYHFLCYVWHSIN